MESAVFGNGWALMIEAGWFAKMAPRFVALANKQKVVPFTDKGDGGVEVQEFSFGQVKFELPLR